jgi:hypothetical protein
MGLRLVGYPSMSNTTSVTRATAIQSVFVDMEPSLFEVQRR